MENFLKDFKFRKINKWIFVDPPPIVPRASLYSFSDYAKTFLPTNADIIVVNESGSCTIEQILQLIEYAKKHKSKLILSGEGVNANNTTIKELNLSNEFAYAIEMCIGTINNPNEIYVPQPWFRMQQGWKRYKQKMVYQTTDKKFFSTMRCKNNYYPKMLLYQELEKLQILDKFMWSCTFREPNLKSNTPKFFDSEKNFQGVNAELPSLEQTQSFTHTVIETARDVIVSEKIWQAFAFSQPIYWWSINDYFKVVEDFGFITEFDGIDSSYLKTQDYNLRSQLLAKELQKLVDYPDLARDLLIKNKDAVQHNYELFFDENKCKQSGIKALQSIIDI
jgi:hypothetical protein